MKTFDPYVKCIGVMDERLTAWNTSRPEFDHSESAFSTVEDMDLSINSMKVYTLEIGSSILFRDLIFSIRPINGWARTIRNASINYDNLRLSTEFSTNYSDYEKIVDFLAMDAAGHPRDKIRDLLPMSASTVYTITIDHRCLMGFLKSIKILNKRLFEIYGICILDAINGLQAFENSTVKPIHDFLMIHDSERKYGLQTAGNMVFGYAKMKCALAAQFLRQHHSKIKIDYWNIVPDYFNQSFTQSDRIHVAYYIDKVSYHNLMKMRAHWIPDWSDDMWGSMISDYTKHMTTEEFWDFLPNGNGKKDPYFADNYNRVIRKDPGAPCPIMCEWPAMIDIKAKEVGENDVVKRYRDLVSEGFIKDNPENEYRKLYLTIGV